MTKFQHKLKLLLEDLKKIETSTPSLFKIFSRIDSHEIIEESHLNNSAVAIRMYSMMAQGCIKGITGLRWWRDHDSRILYPRLRAGWESPG